MNAYVFSCLNVIEPIVSRPKLEAGNKPGPKSLSALPGHRMARLPTTQSSIIWRELEAKIRRRSYKRIAGVLRECARTITEQPQYEENTERCAGGVHWSNSLRCPARCSAIRAISPAAASALCPKLNTVFSRRAPIFSRNAPGSCSSPSIANGASSSRSGLSQASVGRTLDGLRAMLPRRAPLCPRSR